jgi:hypothetical protein
MREPRPLDNGWFGDDRVTEKNSACHAYPVFRSASGNFHPWRDPPTISRKLSVVIASQVS